MAGRDTDRDGAVQPSSDRHGPAVVVVGESTPYENSRPSSPQYHAFNAAVCLGTLVLMSPTNIFAKIVLGYLDQVIAAYTSVMHSHPCSRLVHNLQWILRLRQRAGERVAMAEMEPIPAASPEDFVDAGLLGWRTRFIERAEAGRHARTAPKTAARGIEMGSLPQVVQQHLFSETAAAGEANQVPACDNPEVALDSTEQFVSQPIPDRELKNVDWTAARVLGSDHVAWDGLWPAVHAWRSKSVARRSSLADVSELVGLLLVRLMSKTGCTPLPSGGSMIEHA